MAKTSQIKPSQLTRVGYTYQDLVCIRMLVDWFHEPKKYQWMSIEGNKELGHIKSLDDVVCYTSSGEFELYQVKFTIDSNRDDLKLDFEWLLEKKKKGTSLIQKWSSDIEKFGDSKVISIAKLITNRKPDTIFSNCLNGKKIDHNLIPDEIKTRILTQLGDERKVIKFFEYFIFEHSQKEIDDLEKKLQDSLVPDHANNESWFQLLKAIERWATRKNEPSPNGRICLEHIHEILSLGSIRTISQFFEVPGGYIPPLEEFHKEILERTTKPGCSVISGLPGMGKSTYLSFLTDQLIEKKTPVIRHHYYLSPHFIGDRIAFNNAAQSLQSQIKNLYPFDFDSDKPEPHQLDTWICKAAAKAAENDEMLVVIIDGLDHVYRERSDISQLEHLVNRIDPLKEKICLLYGTQPISDEYLPNALLRSAPRASWIDIPAMGLNAIKERIDFLVSVDEIHVVGKDEHQRQEIVEISQAFLNISQGYPLHIIYSLNSLRLAEKKISKYDVERLPACPEGDIHSYYENLWVTLSESAKEILLLIANADFSWPNDRHLEFCFDDSLIFRNSYAEIQHLVEKRLSGITPFHSSLFVYLKRKEEFSKSKERLNQKSKAWISQHAPEYWKWGWDWIIEANLGNNAPLLQGITREWLIQSLCTAYPIEHIEQIIRVAENIAFEQSLYPELLRLRLLKMRLLNGPEFQVQDFSKFLDCSLNSSPDTFGLVWRADNLRIIPDNEIVIVAKHLQGKDERIVNACAQEIYRRIQFYSRLEDSNHYQTLNSLIDSYLRVLVSYDSPDLECINEFYERLSDKSSSLIRIVELLVQYGHRHLLLDLSLFDIPEGIYSKIIDEVVLAASIEDVSVEESPNLKITNSNLGSLYLFLKGKAISSEENPELECPIEHEAATYPLFYQYFFNTLVSRLSKSDIIEEPQLAEPNSIAEFIKNAWLTFQYASSTVAAKIKAGEKFEILALYNSFAVLQPPERYKLGHQLNTVLFNIRKSLAKVAIHLNILCNSIDEFTKINKVVFSEIEESIWWRSRIFFDVAAQNSIVNLPRDITSQVFHKLFEIELLRREDTATLANDSLELGILASRHGLYDEGSQFLERTAFHIVGYGHRKDLTLHEVFEAIEACSDSNCPQVADWLRRVTTFTTDVFDFSEREINHIPGWFIKLLSKHNPERLVDEFDYHLSEENWHRTNIILKNIVKTFPLSTKSEHSFLRCMTTFDSLTALKERAKRNDTLERIYEEQCNILGGMPPPPKEHFSTETENEETQVRPNASSIQPNNLDELKSKLHTISYKIREQFIADWIAYWVDKKQGATILNSFNLYYEKENSNHELNQCLHKIFLLSKKIEGKTKAYKWAVRDIKLNNCWSRYSYSKAETSLRQYGATYKNQWERLLRDTMSPGSSKQQRDERVIVPSTLMVTYLISAGQINLAAEITEVMVSSLEGDIAHLPLTELYWYDQPVASETIPLHLIYLNYKWPDRYARLQTAKQISTLLQDDSNTEFRSLFLQYLSKQQYEVDIVDYLSILMLLENSPFNKEEITQNIHFPSLISDKLLLNLGYMDEERNDLTTLYSNFSDYLTPNRAKYDRYANGLAIRFIRVIEELEKEYKVLFVKHFLLEWEHIQERQSCSIFNPHNFCNDLFYPQDKISCSFSWPAEASILSAYTRTLAYAIDKHSIPKDVCLMHAQEILPFGPNINLSPSAPPIGWPKLDDLKKNDPLPSQIEVDQYLSQIAKADEILLHANGPIFRNHNGVCLDLKVILVSIENTKIDNPESILNSISYATNTAEGIFPLAKWTWAPSFGRWEIDWLSRGYFQPTYSVGDSTKKSIIQNKSGVEYFCGNISNGVWRYWVDQWYPVHQRDIGNSFGTYITVSKNFFTNLKEHTEGRYYLVAELTCVDRRDLRDKSPIKTFAILPV